MTGDKTKISRSLILDDIVTKRTLSIDINSSISINIKPQRIATLDSTANLFSCCIVSKGLPVMRCLSKLPPQG